MVNIDIRPIRYDTDLILSALFYDIYKNYRNKSMGYVILTTVIN